MKYQLAAISLTLTALTFCFPALSFSQEMEWSELDSKDVEEGEDSILDVVIGKSWSDELYVHPCLDSFSQGECENCCKVRKDDSLEELKKRHRGALENCCKRSGGKYTQPEPFGQESLLNGKCRFKKSVSDKEKQRYHACVATVFQVYNDYMTKIWDNYENCMTACWRKF